MFTVALVYGGGRGIARSWLYCLCCTTTVYNARLKRFKRLIHLHNAYNRRYPLIHEIHYLGAY